MGITDTRVHLEAVKGELKTHLEKEKEHTELAEFLKVFDVFGQPVSMLTWSYLKIMAQIARYRIQGIWP